MTNWNQRITEAREARQMSKADLMRACGVKAPTVTGWESGDIKTLEAGNLLKICDALKVDPWWLILGKGKFSAPNTEDKTPLSNEARKLIMWVERVDRLGDPAPKLFANINAALQVAGVLTQVQNSLADEAEAMAGARERLISHIEHSEGKQRATPKHKP
jgi:transcriptional regulator with XRE-family HTH domain